MADTSDSKPSSGGAGGQDTSLHLSADQLASLHQDASLETTLFDIAKNSLAERSKLTGEGTDRDHIYLELNRIMSLNSYQPANLGDKQKISDKDLPKSWNHVVAHQDFKLYDSSTAASDNSDPLAQLKAKLRQQIIDETSTVPVQKGEGYWQVWQRMHPELSPDQVNREAHRIKAINGNRDVLRVGERLPTATEAEREKELERRLKEAQGQKPDNGNRPTNPPGQAPDKTPAGPDKTPQTPGQTPDHPPGTPPDHPPGAPSDHPGGQPPGSPDNKTPGPPPGTKPDQPPGKTPDAPPAQNQPPKPADSGPDLNGAYLQLVRQHNIAVRDLKADESGQGIIGKAFDAAKNTIGTSGDGHSWYDPRRIWSGVFDSDLGSKTVNQKIDAEKAKLDQLKQAADAKDLGKFSSIYKDITGQAFDVTGKTGATAAGVQVAKTFDQSQHNGVDGITDIGVAVAVAASLRSGKLGMTETLLRGIGTGALVGGVSKAGLMQIDGHYANLKHDLTTGALVGATVPIGELGGAQLSKLVGKRLGMTVTGDLLGARLETQGASLGTKLLSAATKSGVSGGIFGAIESPGRLAINDVEEGREIKVSDLAAASLKGSVFGFLGGTALGAATDAVTSGFRTLRPGTVKAFKPTINGVDVPASGGVGLDQAAKILKMDPADLADQAATDPYAAVNKAVKLYEKTGLNIKKTDPLTGDGVLPKPFEEALTTVQNVDLLTTDAAASLSGKVKVVQATDQFLKTNPSAVDEPMARVTADPNYQEVVKLKTAGEGQQAADNFEKDFRKGFEKDLKTGMAVQQVKTDGLQPADALKQTQPEVEAAYKQKAADYFKDMTDPAQRQRLNDLVEDIYKKFNPEVISKTDLETTLAAIPAADRQLAVALLHESAGTSSDVMLRARFQALKGELSNQVGSYSPDNVYTLAPDSSANLLGYLYRKSNSISMDMHNIDALAAKVQSGHTPSSVVLFDDLSSTPISQANMAVLKQIPNVYVVDVGAFEKAVNIIDVSKGPQAVAAKLDALLTEARTIKAANPGMLDTGVAKLTMQSGVDKAASSIGGNVHVIRPSAAVKVSGATGSGATGVGVPNTEVAGTGATGISDAAQASDVDELYAQFNTPKASKDQIATFLSGYVGEERELAARMLAEGAVHNSFPVMVRKAVDLHAKLSDALAKSGMTMKDLLVVSDKDPGGSTHLISYLFGKANGVSPENFISSQRLNQIISGGMARDKAVAYFDDTIYSGSQATGMLNNNVSSLMPFKKVVIASLGAYDKGINSIKGTHLASLGKVEVATSSMHQPFYSSSNPFFGQLGSSQQHLVQGIGGTEGFGSVQGSLIWSYMYPDNNLNFFGPKFSGNVLHLPGP